MQHITLNTKNTTYQIGVNEYGFLLHLYYGPVVDAEMSNLLTYGFRCGHGTPYEYKKDPSFSCDFSPQEYSCMGSGCGKDTSYDRGIGENGRCSM